MQRSIIIVVALLAAASASADIPAQSVYVGIYGGSQFQLTSWHLHERELVDDPPAYVGTTGIRIGGMVHSLVAVEAGIGITPYASEADEINVALNYTAGLQLHFFEGDWVPFLGLGAGLYHNVAGDHGADVDYNVSYGLGVRGMLTDWLALRIDVRHFVSDGFLDELAHNVEVALGLDFFVWVDSEPASE